MLLRLDPGHTQIAMDCQVIKDGAYMVRLMTVCHARLENPGLEGCLTRHAIVWPYARRLSV